MLDDIYKDSMRKRKITSWQRITIWWIGLPLALIFAVLRFIGVL